MSKLMRAAVLHFGLLGVAASHAATFYIDAAGGDNTRDGRSASTAWHDLSQASRVPQLAAGDQLLFRCGQRHVAGFRLGARWIAGQPLPLLGSYGSGCGDARPTLTGAAPVAAKAVRVVDPGLLEVALTEAPAAVWVGGVRLAKASFPADGSVALLQAGDGPASAPRQVRVKALSTLGSALVGADIVLRSEEWRVEIRRIVAAAGDGTLTLDQPFQYRVRPGSGYRIIGVASLKPRQGAWYYDAGRHVVRVSTRTAATAQAPVQVAAARALVTLTGAARLQGLDFVDAGQDGLAATGADVEVVDCGFTDIARDGLAAASATVRVDTSRFTRVGRDAVSLQNAKDAHVLDNTIQSSGELDPLGEAYAAINATMAEGVEISGNTIAHSAYAGIRVGVDAVVTDNLVIDSCERLDDCGAIYTWNRARGAEPVNTRIEGNVIVGAAGNPVGRIPRPDGIVLAAGIYLDEQSNAVDVGHNLVVDTVQGIFLNDAYANEARDNIVIDTRVCGICGNVQDNAQTAAGFSKNKWIGNGVFPRSGIGLVFTNAHDQTQTADSDANVIGTRSGSQAIANKFRRPDRTWSASSDAASMTGFAVRSLASTRAPFEVSARTDPAVLSALRQRLGASLRVVEALSPAANGDLSLVLPVASDSHDRRVEFRARAGQ